MVVHHGKHGVSPRQGISNNIRGSCLVLDSEVKTLEKFDPRRMERIQMSLALDEFESLMIRIENKRTWQQVVRKIDKGSNKSVKFLVVRGIFFSGLVQLFTEKGDGFSFLGQDRADTNAASIALKFKWLAKIQQS
jgi:hypothetical protein